MGRVYLIHFDQPFSHARHYIGFTRLTVEERVARHFSCDGAKLLKAVTRAGIAWRVVRVWEGKDQDFERKLKRQKHSKRYCPICKGEQP